jgi:hypothetical protein
MEEIKWKAIAQMPNGYAIEDNKGRLIAMTQCDEYENDDNPITWQEEIAHANLIALAPQLLDAIVKISNELAFGNYQGNKVNDMLNLANDVIAKAKGK